MGVLRIENRFRRLELGLEPAVWALDLTDPEAGIADISCLSDEELERADEFTSTLLRDQFILRRGLARLALGRELGIPPEHVAIGKGRRGEPLFDEGGVSFSSSGTVGLVAYYRGRVGVDVEALIEIDTKPLLADYFTEAEQAWVAASDDPLVAFYEGWTRKEAASKLVGLGMAAPLREYSAVGRFRVKEGRIESAIFEPKPGYVAALAWLTP